MHSGKAIDCCCFCNEQLKKNVKCGKEYLTLNVSNIVLVIFKTFITFCWEKKRIKKKSHIKSKSQYCGKKSQLDYLPKSFSPSLQVRGFYSPKKISLPVTYSRDFIPANKAHIPSS